MRFLADQDVFAGTIRFLAGLGHDIVPVAQLGLAQATDTQLLQVAIAQRRALVTRDRDYGGLVFVQGTIAGVIYLRILPSNVDAVHAELERALSLYSESELLSAFLVVEPARHRLRRLGP